MKINIELKTEYRDTKERLYNLLECEGNCEACEFKSLENTLGCELLEELNKDGLVTVVNDKSVEGVEISKINVYCSLDEKNKLVTTLKTPQCSHECSRCVLEKWNNKYCDFCYTLPFAYEEGLVNFIIKKED